MLPAAPVSNPGFAPTNKTNNMATKNTRKRKALKYPRRAEFTIADIIALNADLNEQTVRTHVRQAILDAKVHVLGTNPTGGRGRPRFVLARAS